MEAAQLASQVIGSTNGQAAKSCPGPRADEPQSNKCSEPNRSKRAPAPACEPNNNNTKRANLVSQPHPKQQQENTVSIQGEHQLVTSSASHLHQQTTNNNNANNLSQNASTTSSSPTTLSSTCASSNNKESEESQVNARDFGLLTKETQELKIKTRKLQLEIDEKNEIINILKDELETTKEQNDKFQRDNLQLLKDSKRVKFLQDENDFLQDKVGNVDKLELELKRLKEKLAETEFLKLRIGELEEDRTRAQEESSQFEEKWQKAEQKLTRVTDLETELNKWKLFSHELEQERNLIQSKLLESIEQEAKLNSTNKQVEDEVKRLRSLVKSYEEQRDEEQASNSLIMSVADLKQLDQQQSSQLLQDHSDTLETAPTDTSIKFEIDQQLEKELNEENRNLKQKLSEQELELNKLIGTNKEIRNELESNKELISDLRQDLACEKSLASKLTKQLTAVTKQIKNLDKQYFPMHDVSTQQSPPTSSSPPSLPIEAVTPSSLITQKQTTDRKSQISNDNTINNKRYKHEEKESSLLKSVTSLEYQRQLQSRDLVKESSCNGDKKRPNELQASRSSSGNCSNYNETRQQQVSSTSGTKSSEDEKEPAKNPSQLDNGCKSDEQVNISRDTLKTENKLVADFAIVGLLNGQGLRQPSSQTSAATNKSTAANLDIDNDESHRKNGLLTTVASKMNSVKLDLKQQSKFDDRTELALKTPSPSLLIDREYEPVGKKNIHNADNSTINNSCNNYNSINTQNRLTNVSPSSNTCSQSSSPSTTVTVGHDSGFQSINHDFNHQLSSPSLEARKASSSIRTAAEDVDPAEVTTSETGVARKQFASPLTNRSTAITVQGGVKSDSKAAQTTGVGATANRSHPLETPTNVGNRVPIAANAVPATNAVVSNHEATSGSYSGKSSRDGSHQEQQAPLASAKATSPISASGRSNQTIDGSNATENNNYHTGRRAGADTIDVSTATVGAESLAAGTKLDKSQSAKTTRAFVRNSLPSRSVNFGHSKSSAYLDRIRASVTATTTTNTTSSFNEQSRNIVLSSSQPGQVPLSAPTNHHHPDARSLLQPRYVLNCMLDHQHGERCYIDHAAAHHAGHVHASQQPVTANYDGQRAAMHKPILPASRQLNALIDPVSNEQLMMSLLHQNHANGLTQQQQQLLHHRQQALHSAQGAPYAPLEVGGGDLSEQQIARLANLHHQHYYHHLQHMHQLHQLHHQHHMHVHHHRMHHRYQQQQQQQQTAPGAPVGPQQPEGLAGGTTSAASKTAQRFCEQPIYSGGSQFYAPSAQFDQIYSSMTANNNINQQQQQVNDIHKSRLVNPSGNGNKNQVPSPETNGQLRSSPGGGNSRSSSRVGPMKATQHQHPSQPPTISGGHYATLPQIDEVNGLPTVESVVGTHHQHRASPMRQHRNAQVVMTSEAMAKAQQHNSSSNGSPSSSSSSPTSSASSSNLSPSSASSSSSLNSLSTSSAPLNRSALRHSTNEHSRRQFSIERDLTGALPMTATLSRVGSCRVNRSTDDGVAAAAAAAAAAQSLCHNRNASASPQVMEGAQMRTPAKSQQPSMRTSKILNISQQSGNAQLPLAHHQQQQQKQASHNSNSLGNRRSHNAIGAVAGVDKLASNLANIRLNDSLAFTSLRAPKNCPGLAGSLNRSLTNGTSGGGRVSQTPPTANGHQAQTSSSKLASEKRRLAAAADKQASDSEVGNSGKSSVWFEYGCV